MHKNYRFLDLKSNRGRSMLEMLGVLAIIGILSLGGLFGYKIAMTYHKSNETIHDVMLRATNVPMKWEDYQEWREDDVFNFSDMGAYSVSNTMGYPVTVMAKGTAPSGTTYAFRVEVENVPVDVCQRIHNMNPTAVDEIEPALSDCADDEYDGTMTFYFDEDFSNVPPGPNPGPGSNPDNPLPECQCPVLGEKPCDEAVEMTVKYTCQDGTQLENCKDWNTAGCGECPVDLQTKYTGYCCSDVVKTDCCPAWENCGCERADDCSCPVATLQKMAGECCDTIVDETCCPEWEDCGCTKATCCDVETKECGQCETPVTDDNGCVIDCTPAPTSCGQCETESTDDNGCLTCLPDTTDPCCRDPESTECKCKDAPTSCEKCYTEGTDENGCKTCTPPPTECTEECKVLGTDDNGCPTCVDDTEDPCCTDPDNYQRAENGKCISCPKSNPATGNKYELCIIESEGNINNVPVGEWGCCCVGGGAGWHAKKDGSGECILCGPGKVFDDYNDCVCPEDKPTECGLSCCSADESCTALNTCCPSDKTCGTRDCCLNGEQCQEYYNGRDDIYDSMCCDGYAYYDYNADEPACCPSDREFSWDTETCCAKDEKAIEWDGCCKTARVYEYEDEWGGTYTACCPQDLCGTSCCGNGETCTNGECCPSNRKLNSTTCCPVGTQVVNGECKTMCEEGKTSNKTGTSCHSCSDLLSGCNSVRVSEYPNIGEDCPNLFIGREDGDWYGDEPFAFGCNWNCESDRRPQATISECEKCGDNRYWDGCTGRDEYAGCIRKEYDGSQFTFDGAQISGCAKDNYTLNSCKNGCAQCPYPGFRLNGNYSDYPYILNDCPDVFLASFSCYGCSSSWAAFADCDEPEASVSAAPTSLSECLRCGNRRYIRGGGECALVTDDLHGTIKDGLLVSCDEGYVIDVMSHKYRSECAKCPEVGEDWSSGTTIYDYGSCENVFISYQASAGSPIAYSCAYTGSVVQADKYHDSICAACPNRPECL